MPDTQQTSGAVSKTEKYQSILQTHLFTPIAIETAGVWNNQAREFIKELGKRITTVTGEVRETSYILQQISLAIYSERQHAVFHWVIHHRHGLNNNTNNSNSNDSDNNNNIIINNYRQCPYDTTVTEDTKEFLALHLRSISARLSMNSLFV